MRYVFLEDVTKWVDEESPVNIIYLYFKNAFDKVPHQGLLFKLKAHGWIEKWVIGRRQRIVADREVSNYISCLRTIQKCLEKSNVMQIYSNDLNKLTEWSEKWQVLFNFGKCKCLHTGHGNEDA